MMLKVIERCLCFIGCYHTLMMLKVIDLSACVSLDVIGKVTFNFKLFLVEGLVELVEKDENLCKKLLDPRYVLALNELQQNPVAAMQKYKDDEELQDFLRQFCGILGEKIYEAIF